MTHIFKKDYLLLIGLCALLYVLNLWGYPLFDVDEPRYAETAREMLTDPGDWITPHFNWITRFDKPVLFYWLIAGVYKVLGVSAFSARLVSAAAATGIVLMLFTFVKAHASRQAAWVTALVFATMVEVWAMARWSITDMTLSAFMAGSWLTLFLAYTKSTRWYLAAGAFTGLGILTKGPVALALPGLTLLIYALWFERQHWRRLLSPWTFAGLALMLAIAMPWYWAVAQANPEEFVGKFFFLHNVQRFTSTVSGHAGPWYYYIPVLLLGAMPWSLFLPQMLTDLWVQRKALPPHIRYAALWGALVFLFFSASGTKLLTYILPGFAALAMLMGWYWQRQMQNTEVRAPLNASPIKAIWPQHSLRVALLGLAAILALAMVKPYQLVPPPLHHWYQPVVVQGILVLLLVTFGLALFRMRGTTPRVFGFKALAAGIIAALVYANVLILPMASRLTQSEIHAYAQRAVHDQMPMATYRIKKPSLVFYTQRKVHFIPEHRDKAPRPETVNLDDTPLHAGLQALYVVVKNRDLKSLQRRYPVVPVVHGQVYSLVKTQVDLAAYQELNQ